MTDDLASLHAYLDMAQRDVERLLALERERVQDRASLAAIPRARLLSTAVQLEGRVSDRLRVGRIAIGQPFEQPFSPSRGVTRCVTESPDVRDLWDRLLAHEAACTEDVLRGRPASILDVPGGTVRVADEVLHVTVGRPTRVAAPVVAIPRCAYDFPRQKLANFGHWLLDGVPQYAALAEVAPNATFLLPPQTRTFHRTTLSLLGIRDDQLAVWNGEELASDRLLVLESDGRAGGGRPFSLLAEMRRRLGVDDERAAAPTRRVYISRRDAPPRRRWVANEPDVEALFRSRGFDVVVMAECPLEEQVRIFREARVVAGVSGAGFSDLLFSRRGTHVMLLISDPLIRWYADSEGARSGWLSRSHERGKQLAVFGDSPRFWAHVAAGFGHVCHSFVAGDCMPLASLDSFVDEALARVDGA